MSELKQLLDALAARDYERAVLVTLVKLEGSGYRKAGARMVIADDGWSAGSVSGGCIEATVRDHARRIVSGGSDEIVAVDTTSDQDILFGSGLGCPGKLEFLFQPFARWEFDARFGGVRSALSRREPVEFQGARVEPPIALHILGAGNDAIPLTSLGVVLGWETIVYDGRESLLQHPRFAESVRLVHTRPQPVRLDRWSAAVITTHNYFLDLDWLRHLLATDAGYIAIVGSQKRFTMLCDVLRDEGVDAEKLARVHGPAGLDIGSETPSEIALSIVAEVKAVLAGRDGRSLRGLRVGDLTRSTRS